MGDTFARGEIVPHVEIDPAGYAISIGRSHYMWIGYFVTPAAEYGQTTWLFQRYRDLVHVRGL